MDEHVREFVNYIKKYATKVYFGQDINGNHPIILHSVISKLEKRFRNLTKTNVYIIGAHI